MSLCDFENRNLRIIDDGQGRSKLNGPVCGQHSFRDSKGCGDRLADSVDSCWGEAADSGAAAATKTRPAGGRWIRCDPLTRPRTSGTLSRKDPQGERAKTLTLWRPKLVACKFGARVQRRMWGHPQREGERAEVLVSAKLIGWFLNLPPRGILADRASE